MYFWIKENEFLASLCNLKLISGPEQGNYGINCFVFCLNIVYNILIIFFL